MAICLTPKAPAKARIHWLKAAAKARGLEPLKGTLEGIVARNAVGLSARKRCQPGAALLAEGDDLGPVVGAADDGTDRDGDDVDASGAAGHGAGL